MRFEPHRVAPFEHLGIGQARVGHVCLHSIDAAETVARAAAARNSFVVLVVGIAEGEVVHRPLTRCHDTERAI